MYPNLTAAGGVRLLVRTSDAEAAIALLNAQASPEEINQIETEAVASAPPETVPQKKLALGQILSGIVVGVILCLLYQWINNLGTKTYYYSTKDGQRAEEWVYRDGQLTEFSQDRNLDGIWDYWTHYEDDRAVRSEGDNNFDGKPDEFWIYSNGFTETMERDTDFNGTPDEFWIYKDSIVQQADVRPNNAKFPTQRWIYQNGVLVKVFQGGDSRGIFREEVQYDPFSNPVSTNALDLLLPVSR